MAEEGLQDIKNEEDELTEILAGNTEQETEELEDDTKEVKEEEEEEKEEEEKEKEEEKEEEEKEEEETEDDILSKELTALKEENARLKAYMRSIKQDLALVKAKTSKSVEEEDEESEPTRIEQLAGAVRQTIENNSRIYELQANLLRQAADTSDIDEVCSASRWDEIVDAAADGIASQKGIDPVEARLEVEYFIWNQDNPYKYMYNVIKEYHPDFVGKGDGGSTKQSVGVKTKTKKAPASVASMNSSATKKSGWTAEKIDNLPETELYKVPEDVYEKYMANELD